MATRISSCRRLPRAVCQASQQAPRGSQQHPRFVSSPACLWLGSGQSKALVGGNSFRVPEGRGMGIHIGLLQDALEFVQDGSNDCFALRKADDPDLALEVSFRQLNNGSRLCLWACKCREWSSRFCANDDGTISPWEMGYGQQQQQRCIRHELVLGVEPGTGELLLVPSTDTERRLETPRGEELRGLAASWAASRDAEYAAEMAFDANALDAAMQPETLQKLQSDGYVRLSGLVQPHLVDRALRELNRELGKQGPGAMRGQVFSHAPAITDLYTKSQVPELLCHLLGGPATPQPGAQLALRFPGDGCCGDDGFQCPPRHWEGHRRHWHIDGCANRALPGVTDHFGHVHNFDCLVGFLLSDVKERFSGELVCYPGSHEDLARHFRSEGLEGVSQLGDAALPTGDRAKEVLSSQDPESILGSTGDVVLANYMVAHLVAPNTSPHVRNAVYFRVRGPGFSPGQHHEPLSMLHPWAHWPGLAVSPTQEGNGRHDDD